MRKDQTNHMMRLPLALVALFYGVVEGFVGTPTGLLAGRANAVCECRAHTPRFHGFSHLDSTTVVQNSTAIQRAHRTSTWLFTAGVGQAQLCYTSDIQHRPPRLHATVCTTTRAYFHISLPLQTLRRCRSLVVVLSDALRYQDVGIWDLCSAAGKNSKVG